MSIPKELGKAFKPSQQEVMSPRYRLGCWGNRMPVPTHLGHSVMISHYRRDKSPLRKET